MKMKQLLTIFLLSQFLILSAQDVRVIPLGYDESSNHFLRTETRSAIYDAHSKMVIADVSGYVSKKEILLDRFLVLEKPTQTEVKLALVDLNTGYVSDFNYADFTEVKGVIYGTDIMNYTQFAFDPLGQLWNEQTEKVNYSTKMNGWEIALNGAPKYKDVVVDIENKKILAKSSSVGSFKGCGPYLLYFPDSNTLIDTIGNIVVINRKVIAEDIDCYKKLGRYPKLDNITVDVFKAEEYESNLIFENNGNVFFGDTGKLW